MVNCDELRHVVPLTREGEGWGTVCIWDQPNHVSTLGTDSERRVLLVRVSEAKEQQALGKRRQSRRGVVADAARIVGRHSEDPEGPAPKTQD